MKEINNRFLVWCAIFACLTGICLRIASFSWNEALNGDVNLFALTAREFALNDQLDYPMKYEFSDQVDYLALHTPASQHPPLWGLIGGIISKIIPTNDTFSVLKIVSEITGLLLLAAIALMGCKSTAGSPVSFDLSGSKINITALSLASLTAILVDFSANGSPYILMALWLMLSSWLLLRFEPQKFSHLFYAGILCTLAILTHSAMLLLPLGFIFAIFADRSCQTQSSNSKSHLKQIALFLMVLTSGLSPWLLWNMQKFGQIFHSYSSNYLFNQLGLLHTGIYDDVITSRLELTIPVTQILKSYAILAIKSVYALCREFLLLVSPFGLILSVVGFIWGVKTNKGQIISLLLPTVSYLAVISLWATYKFRFLTPLMPVFSLLTALGFMVLLKQRRIWPWFAGLCLIGAVAWSLIPFFQNSKTLYYGHESQAHDTRYAEMQPLAISLATRSQGVVLGYSQYLDGGIETVYWHRFPSVAGRDMSEKEIKKLVTDFDIRYIWADVVTFDSLQQWFPEAKLIDQSGEFVILELPD